MVRDTYYSEPDYRAWLKEENFNEEQIDFLCDRLTEYHNLKREEHFDYDTYERDMWYTMNRSGLFEDIGENETEIYDWDPYHTRMYITETSFS